MAAFNKFLIVALLIAVAACNAEPPRFGRTRRIQQRSRRPFARQAAAPPAVAPYPTAEELKPEIPFEEGVAAEPDLTYGPPDQTYGPPDQTYGPPTDTLEQLPSDEQPQEFVPDPDAEEFATAEVKVTPARFRQHGRQIATLTRSAAKQTLSQSRREATRSQRLVVSLPQQSESIPIAIIPAEAQQIRFINQPFAYTPQVQVW